jgi:hypothetical protein
MARAITGPELADLRTRMPPARSEIFLAVLTPAVVWTARVNEPAGITLDRLAELDYDGGSGAADWGNTLADMTVYFGSAAGEFDHGMARLRSFAAGSDGVTGTMEIGETSELDVADNDYITVVNEFAPWPKHMRISDDGTVYMDYDVAYTDEHLYPDPVPVLGPPACVWLPAGGTVDVDFDAGDSWSPIVPGMGYTFVWACDGAAGIVGGNTDTPTIRFNATGTYRASCTVTADYGGGNTASFTGHRYVFVFDANNMPTTRFTLDNCAGDWASGGWSYSVTMYEEAEEYDPATVTGVRDRALCVLFARDWYNGAEGSIGPIDDRENVIVVGWIDGESITRNPVHGTVGFEVEGPQYWLGQMTGFPSGIEDYDGNPTDWTEFEDLTVDKGLWHFLHWRTTVTRMMDVYLTGDDRQIAVFDAPLGSLWEQLTQASENTILAHPACDRYGRLYIEIDSQLVPVADRTPVVDVPVVMDVTPPDWREQLDIQRQTVKPVSQVDLSGVAYDDGAALAIFSLARGHVFNCYGKVVKAERLALEDQAQANSLAGLIMAHENNEYPNVDIPLSANNRMIDICPWQYVKMSIAPDDTERGIEWIDKYLVPRRVSFDFRQGSILADIETEAVTGETASTDGDVPPIPSPPPPPPPPPGPPPPPELPLPAMPGDAFLYNRTHILYTANFDAVPPATPNWVDITGTIRAVGANPNYAYIASVEADAGGVALWAVTCKNNITNNDTDPDVGVWYNPDPAGAGSWHFCASQEAMEAASRIAIGACSINDVWGQVRSILSVGAGAALCGEAKNQSGGAAIANCSSFYMLENNGLSWHYVDVYGSDYCGCGLCSDGVTTYVARQRWLTQYEWWACHQIASAKPGGGGLRLYPGSDFSNKRLRCDSEDEDWWPKFPTLNDGIGANSNYLGDRTATQYAGVYYGLTEQGPTDKKGVLWSGNQDAAGIVDIGCNENHCYVPIASGHHLYWCKGDATGGAPGTNLLKRNGATLYQSVDLFGTLVAGNAGAIGYVRVWKRSDSDGLIIVRKDRITNGMAQPNKSVVYWYSPDDGLLDKTGDLHAVIGANGWAGAGPNADPAQNWNFKLDNVGVAVWEIG